MSATSLPKPTQAETTKIAYAKRFRQLWLRARRELKKPDLRAIEFATWLVAQQGQLKPRSFRQYRAAAIFALKHEMRKRPDRPHLGILDALKLLEDTQGQTVTAHDGAVVQGLERAEWKASSLSAVHRTSSSKAKSMTDEGLERILAAARGLRSGYAADLIAFLKANVLCGLRPIEWHGTSINYATEVLVMLVPNAKHTNDRAHGPKRTLIFNSLAELYRDDLVNWADRVNVLSSGEYKSLLKRVEEVMRGITKRLFPKKRLRPTPSTTRHVFSGRLKAFYLGRARTDEEYDLGRAMIAALMGHATDDTADFHYGKKSETSGRGLPIPQADPAEVAKIRPRLARSREKLRALEARRASPRPR